MNGRLNVMSVMCYLCTSLHKFLGIGPPIHYQKNESVGEKIVCRHHFQTSWVKLYCPHLLYSITIKNECVTFYPKVKKKIGFPFNSEPEIGRRVSFLLLPSLSLIYLHVSCFSTFWGMAELTLCPSVPNHHYLHH